MAGDGSPVGVSTVVPDVIRQRRLVKFGLATGLIMLAIGVIGVVTYAETTTQLQSESQQNLETTTELASLELDTWRSNHASRIRELAADRRVKPGQGGNARVLVRTFLITQLRAVPDDVTAFHVTERLSGTVFASTDRERETRRFDQDWLDITEMSFEDGVFVSPVYERNGTQRVAFVTQLDEYLLVMETNVTQTLQELRQPTATSFVTLTDSQRTVVGSDRPELVGARYADGPVWTTLSDAFEGNTTYVDGTQLQRSDGNITFDSGERHLVSAVAVPGTDWVVVIHTPESEAFTIANAVARNVLIIVGVSLVALVLVGIGLVRQTVRELRRLGQKAQELESGDLDIELETHLDDEIGDLYESFDEMRRQLKARITEAEQLNEHLEVTDRLLRHNLHNDMNVVRLHARMIQDGEGDLKTHVERIFERTDALVEKADKQRQITELIMADPARDVIDIGSHVERIADSLRQRYPSATINLDLPSETVTVEATAHLPTTLTELMENALEHNDQETPRLDVEVTHADGMVSIRVADNGPLLADENRRVLTGDQEVTQLEHATGIGLWLVYWTVRTSGGRLHYEANDPRGNVVVVELPE